MKYSRVFLAMTGASGSGYALRILSQLLLQGVGVTFCVSPNGALVCRDETGLGAEGISAWLTAHGADVSGLETARYDDLFFRAASGSSFPDAMIIAPCSMGTLARVASGNSGNLIERCADVALKEGKPLILVPRETPLSTIHLENMLRTARAGARIVPAMPAFYSSPRSIDDILDFVAGKVLDQLEIPHSLYRRWGNDA